MKTPRFLIKDLTTSLLCRPRRVLYIKKPIAGLQISLKELRRLYIRCFLLVNKIYLSRPYCCLTFGCWHRKLVMFYWPLVFARG